MTAVVFHFWFPASYPASLGVCHSGQTYITTSCYSNTVVVSAAEMVSDELSSPSHVSDVKSKS